MREIDLIHFSARALRGHRLRTILSLLGVAIGVGSVIILTSLGEGARRYVTGEFASLGTNLLIVLPGKTETHGVAPFLGATTHDLTIEDSEALGRRVREIRRIAPLSLGSASVKFGDRSRATYVMGTTNEMIGVRKLQMGVGRFLPSGVIDAPVCVLGAKVRSELFATANPLGEMVRIGDARLRVMGVLAPRGTSIGFNIDETVYVPVRTAMRMFNRSSLFRLMIEVGSHDEIPAARQDVLRVLKERHQNVEDVTVLTQDAVLATFNQILIILTGALAAIAAISLTVAGIGIMNVMLVSVSERTQEIGLLKSIGVTRRQILGAFLIEAAIVSTAGGIVGLGGGLGVGRIVERIVPDFPVHPPLWAVAAALVLSMSVGLLFGSLPARRAAAFDPVEALARGTRG